MPAFEVASALMQSTQPPEPMQSAHQPEPAHSVASLEVEQISALAEALAQANFTVDGVAEFLGESANAALSRDQFVPALLATGGLPGDVTEAAVNFAEPLPALIRFFLTGEPLSEAALHVALPHVDLDALETAGILSSTNASSPATPHSKPARTYLPGLDLRPYSFLDENGEVNLWVASDLSERYGEGALRRDHVLGIGQASLTLVQSVNRAPVERALDLGCGCGIQTFHLLRHARYVVATDISQRALDVTRLNLLLNAEALAVDRQNLDERVSLRLGSGLEPVRHETFDLAVSNPPFVITPRTGAAAEYTYRDAGYEGDAFLAGLLGELPSVLAAGGIAHLLGNWELHDQPWYERVKQWIPGSADAWVIQRDASSPEGYAETWLRDAAQNRDPHSYAKSYAEYLDDFARRGVTAVGFGLIWMRHRDLAKEQEGSAALRRFEEIEHPIERPIAPAWAAAVERSDWLEAHELSAARLDVAEDITEERHQFPGAEHPGVILLRQGGGFRRSKVMTTESAGFVSACDGTLTVGQIIGALEALLGYEMDLDGLIRELVVDGFVLPTTTR